MYYEVKNELPDRTVYTYYKEYEDLLKGRGMRNYVDFKGKIVTALKEKPVGVDIIVSLRPFLVEKYDESK